MTQKLSGQDESSVVVVKIGVDVVATGRVDVVNVRVDVVVGSVSLDEHATTTRDNTVNAPPRRDGNFIGSDETPRSAQFQGPSGDCL
jgi:hypothetical protein